LLSSSSSAVQLAIGIVFSYVLSVAVGRVFVKFADTFSNRESFARLFPLVSSATCLIIAVVKSSLALSLGLVGALSIVRFRTAIKDPEELIYLFISIAIGLACGASQFSSALTGFVLIMLGASLLKTRSSKMRNKNSIRLSIGNFPASALTKIATVATENSRKAELLTFVVDESSDGNSGSASFSLVLSDIDAIDSIRSSIQSIAPKASLSFAEITSI
jgi:uncharacterized membrane protein YhiD involved in acid resistance